MWSISRIIPENVAPRFPKNAIAGLPEMPHSLKSWKGVFVLLCLFATLGAKLILTYHAESPKLIRRTNHLSGVEECPRDVPVYMLVVVGSHPDHEEIRKTIRHTWGNPRLKNYKFKLVFLFGKVTNNAQHERLQVEHGRYGDILTGNFLDSYHNVTLRDLMGLKWAVQNCPRARYILRADDDIALDIYKLIGNLDKYYSSATNLLACFAIITNAVPRREGRYAVSINEYSDNVYPNYCDGWAYVLTPDVALKIVQASTRRKPMWINDVYITGTLANDMLLTHKLLYLNFTYSYNEMKTFAQNLNSSYDSEITYDLGPIQQDTALLLHLQEVYRRKAIRNKFINEFG